MRKSQADIKAKLLAQYESILDDILSQNEESVTLTEIEELALRARAEVGRQMTTALLEVANGYHRGTLRCKGCGQTMRNKGEKHRYLRTRSGDVEVERAYYYCPQCQVGLFPPG